MTKSIYYTDARHCLHYQAAMQALEIPQDERPSHTVVIAPCLLGTGVGTMLQGLGFQVRTIAEAPDRMLLTILGPDELAA